MRFLPLGVDVRGKSCTVVGGGAVGARKVQNLLQAGASVTVVSPVVSAALAQEIDAGRIQWIKAPFGVEHLEDVHLVVMATDDPEVNEAGARVAGERGALVCNASSAGQTQTIFGALLEEDGVTIATFTDGQDPSRARQTRDQIAALLAGAKGPGEPAEPVASDTVLVLVGHGSRNPDWNVRLEELTATIAAGTGEDRVRLAHSQFASPALEDVVAEAVVAGKRRVVVLPLFMTGEGQVDRHILPVIEDLQKQYDSVKIELLPPVGQHAGFHDLLMQIVREATT